MKNVKPEFPVENSQKRLGTPLPKNRQARFPFYINYISEPVILNINPQRVKNYCGEVIHLWGSHLRVGTSFVNSRWEKAMP